jgi:hypothetical protein
MIISNGDDFAMTIHPKRERNQPRAKVTVHTLENNRGLSPIAPNCPRRRGMPRSRLPLGDAGVDDQSGGERVVHAIFKMSGHEQDQRRACEVSGG